VIGPFELDRGGWIGGEEVVPAEAGVTFTALRVEDPERRPAPRRAVAVAGHQRLGALADDVPSEPDPCAPSELQAEPGRAGHRARQVAGQTGRLEHHEERLRAPGQGRQPVEPIGQTGRTVRGRQAAGGQVQDEQIDRAPGQQRAADGQRFVERLGSDHHQPLEPDAAGDRLDRVEAPGEVDPGHDGTGRLGLRGQPVGKRGPAARAVTTKRDARRARQAAWAQDGVQFGETGPDDPLVGVRPRRGFERQQARSRRRRHDRAGRQSQGTVRDPRSCGSPASLEARHGRRHVRGEGRHRTSKIEHLFYRINPQRGTPGRHDAVTQAT
jgi:hypothetical protein